jgi:hypothetical protein
MRIILGLTSFEGCPKRLRILSIVDVEVTSFEEFPDFVDDLYISPSKGSLMILHEKFHRKEILICTIMHKDMGFKPNMKLSDTFKKLSDPFEFQDWCIENGYEEYL